MSAAVDLLDCSFGGRAEGLVTCIDCELSVHADRDAVLQILVNVVKNAIEATSDVAKRRVRVSAVAIGSDVAIRVKDNGVGADAEAVRAIFTRGYSTKHHGHGFGLHSAKALACAMAGSVEFESQGEGRGATVTLILPGRLARAA